MPIPVTPIVTPMFFPQALKFRSLWRKPGKTHGLTQKDFEWFSHLKIANHTLRGEQKPPMVAEKILLKTKDLDPVPLAGSFVLSATPDDNGVILYTPYAGICANHPICTCFARPVRGNSLAGS